MSVKFEELRRDGSVKKDFKRVKWIAIGLAALIIALNSFTIVPAGNTGVVMTLGKVSGVGGIKGLADCKQHNCRKLSSCFG